MKQFWEDFKKFIKRGNVVDMAVGVAVASAFTAIVTAFTKGFITPILALISNTSNTEELKYIIRPEILDEATGEVIQGEIAILWGGFVQAIINFLIVALTLFIMMRLIARFEKRVRNILTDEDEKAAAAAAKAKEEEEKKAAEAARAAAAAEAAAAEAAAKAAAELAAEKARLEREEALLTEIRDLLKNK